MKIIAKNNKVTTMNHIYGHLIEEIVGDPMEILEKSHRTGDQFLMLNFQAHYVVRVIRSW